MLVKADNQWNYLASFSSRFHDAIFCFSYIFSLPISRRSKKIVEISVKIRNFSVFSSVKFSYFLFLESNLPLCNFVVASRRGVKVSFSTQLVYFKRAKLQSKIFRIKVSLFLFKFFFSFGFDAKFSFSSAHLFCSTISWLLFMFY